MKRKHLPGMVVGILFFSILSGVNGVTAMPLTWQLTGEVSSIGIPLTQYFSIGDSVDFVFTFETTTPDSQPNDSTFGEYLSAITTARISVGAYSALIENYDLNVYNDRFGSFDLFTFCNPSPNTVFNGPSFQGSDGHLYRFDGVYCFYEDSQLNMLPSDSLPTSPDALNQLADRTRFGVRWITPLHPNLFLGTSIGATNLQLTDITPSAPAPVPEPTTMLLFGSGLAALAGIRIRNRKK